MDDISGNPSSLRGVTSMPPQTGLLEYNKTHNFCSHSIQTFCIFVDFLLQIFPIFLARAFPSLQLALLGLLQVARFPHFIEIQCNESLIDVHR